MDVAAVGEVPMAAYPTLLTAIVSADLTPRRASGCNRSRVRAGTGDHGTVGMGFEDVVGRSPVRGR